MRLEIIQRAEEWERFAPNSWDSQIGETVPFRAGDVETTATLLAAEVAPDGSSVTLTLNVHGDVPA